MAALLPPDVAQEDFDRALAEFRAIVGDEWVMTGQVERDSYLDAFAPGDAQSHAASGAIAPESAEQVQAVVKVANKYRIPLWPESTGRNLAYGGAAPVMKGTMVLDLKRMNRILEINTELGYALVEPGVTFFDFFDALQAKGYTYWMSGPAPGWGSIIGNYLEHGCGYTPYGTHADQICGLEVVMPDGDLLRTGMGGTGATEEWQAFRFGYGPVWDGLFTQSNFGVVTKMGIWLMPAPGAVANVNVQLPGDDDLIPLVDTIRPLRLNDTLNATYTLINPYRGIIDPYAVGGVPRESIYDGKGAIPMDIVKRELKKLNLGMWGLNTNVFDNTAEGLEIKLKAIKTAFEKIPGARVTFQRWHPGEPLPGWARQQPILFFFGVVDWYGGPGGHANYAPVCAPYGERVMTYYRSIADRYVEYGFDPYVGFLSMGQRALLINSTMQFNKDDDEQTGRARDLYATLTKDGTGQGLGDYRAHISFMDHVAGMYKFNDHKQRRLNEFVKDALDPNGIIAPGKQGIWPARYRTMRTKI